jgi:PAS domain S-box-containing protein
MRFAFFVEKLKARHVTSLVFFLIAVYSVVNFLPISGSAHELFNSIFSSTLTFSSGLLIFLIFLVAKKNKYIFSKTLFWLSLSFLTWFIADFLWLWLIAINKNPFPSPADLFYFAIYPLLIITIFNIPSTLSPARGIKRIMIEISILILTAILFFLFLAIIPGKQFKEADNFSLFILYLYPVLDLVIIWIILILFFSNQMKSSRGVMKYFIYGIITFSISDLLYFTNSLFGIEDQGYFIDIGYYLFYALILFAAIKGYREVRVKSITDNPIVNVQTSRWISLLPGVFLIAIVGFILFFVFDHFSLSNAGTGVLVILIFILFIIHQYLVIAENFRLNREMSRVNIELERKVNQRTLELNLMNKDLVNEISFRKRAEEILKLSEEKYRLIAENTSDVIWLMELEKFKFSYVSPSVFHLTGYTAEEVINMNFFEFLSPNAAENIKVRLADRLAKYYAGEKAEGANITEIQQICKDGSIIWTEMSTTFIVNNEGRVTDIIGVSRNIEQRKRAEALIHDKNIELVELNATKDKFFSIIAHDLKSPFSSILGFSELLNTNIDKYSHENIKLFANSINNSANLTYKLLENLLEWSQLQRGKITPNLQSHNLKNIVDDVIQLNSEMAVKKNIKLENKIIFNVSIQCDFDITKTILRNLISNAIKFTNSEGHVEIKQINKGAFIEIWVSDTGVGIMPDKIPYLFTIDQDVSTSGTANEKGTGLGLLLCKELVEKQGGEIWVESIVGSGSNFYFTIPYSTASILGRTENFE